MKQYNGTEYETAISYLKSIYMLLSSEGQQSLDIALYAIGEVRKNEFIVGNKGKV